MAAADETVASAERADDLRCAISDTTRLGSSFPIGINADCFYHVGPRKREFSNHAMAQFPFLFFRHVPSIQSRHYVILTHGQGQKPTKSKEAFESV